MSISRKSDDFFLREYEKLTCQFIRHTILNVEFRTYGTPGAPHTTVHFPFTSSLFSPYLGTSFILDEVDDTISFGND